MSAPSVAYGWLVADMRLLRPASDAIADPLTGEPIRLIVQSDAVARQNCRGTETWYIQ